MGRGSGKGQGSGAGCCNKVGDDRPVAPDPTNMERSCTDILFLLGFIAFWVGMVCCAGMGFANGDPVRLLYFVDYNGNRCGEGIHSNNKYTHWTHPINTGTNICVDSCPGAYVKFTLTTATVGNTNQTSTNQSSTQTLGYTRESSDATGCATTFVSTTGCLNSGTRASTLASSNAQCCTFTKTTAPGGMYICVPDSLYSGGTAYAKEYVDKATVIMAAATSDLLTGWYVWLSSLLISLIVSFVWTYILRGCAGCFVWTAVLGSNLVAMALAGACAYLYLSYKDDYDENNLDSDKNMMNLCLVGLICTGILALGLLCMTICLCKQIRIAVGIIQEACYAIQKMPLLVFFPLVQYFAMLVFLLYWGAVAVFMASSGDYKQDSLTGVYTMEWDEEMQQAMVYHFFGLLWNMAFLRHMTILILAGCFGAYYWTPLTKKKNNEYPKNPIMASVYRACRYHLGTVAFGSFIIAVIQMIRVILNYVKKKFEKHLKDKPGGCFIKCLISYIECCMACFERLMEFISKNAYIVTACKGKMFCTAAWEAFHFILNNLGQIAVVNWVSAFLMMLGKIFIVAGTGACCFFLSQTSDDISSPWVLLIVCLMIAYLVASLFLGVVDTAIDTILVCFCWERDAKGNFQSGEVYANDTLNVFIEGVQHLKEQQAAKAAEGEQPAVESTPVEASAAPAGAGAS